MIVLAGAALCFLVLAVSFPRFGGAFVVLLTDSFISYSLSVLVIMASSAGASLTPFLT